MKINIIECYSNLYAFEYLSLFPLGKIVIFITKGKLHVIDDVHICSM